MHGTGYMAASRNLFEVRSVEVLENLFFGQDRVVVTQIVIEIL